MSILFLDLCLSVSFNFIGFVTICSEIDWLANKYFYHCATADNINI